MPDLSVRREYADGSILFAADVDAYLDDIETLLNVTKLNDDNLQDQGITASLKLLDASVSTGKIAAQAVTAAKIANATITTSQISATAGITGGQIATETVTAANLLDGTITTAEISGSAGITGAQLASATVATGNLVDGSVTTAKLADANVTTAKLAANSVTSAKLGLNAVLSSSTGSFTTSSATYTAITNCAISITTSGGPIFLTFVADDTVDNLVNLSGLFLLKDTTAGGDLNQFTNTPMGIWVTPSAGTRVYTLYAKSPDGGTTPANCQYIRMLAIEF